jgi:hypothetical protein
MFRSLQASLLANWYQGYQEQEISIRRGGGFASRESAGRLNKDTSGIQSSKQAPQDRIWVADDNLGLLMR